MILSIRRIVWVCGGDEYPVDPSRSYNILAVGDGTTESVGVDDHKTWPSLLQKELNTAQRPVWVGNAGETGISTRGDILLLKAILPKIKIDTVVVLSGMNDTKFLVRPFERNYGDSREHFFTTAGFNVLSWLLQSFDRLPPTLIAYRMMQIRRTAGFFAVKQIDESMREDPIPKNMVDDALGEYRRNLKSIANIARQYSAKVILLAQPTLYRNSADWT